MKYLLFPVLVVILLFAANCSKDPVIADDLVSMKLSELDSALNLTAEQNEKITEVLIDVISQSREIMDNAAKERGGNRNILQTLTMTARGVFYSVLDSSQMTIISKTDVRFLPNMTLVKLYYKLQLSKTQLVQTDSILSAYRAEMMAMQGEDRESFDREKMMALREKRDEEIGALLSGGQWKIYKTILSDRANQMRPRGGGRGGRGGGR